MGAPEPSAAEHEFNALEKDLLAQPADSLLRVNVDLQVVAVHAIGVGRFAASPPVRRRFAALATTGEYDDRCVDALASVAQAAWYARHRFLLASGTRTEVRVPVTLVNEAMEQRARMLNVAAYWLGDNEKEAAEIVVIRAGTGYLDLANDLTALAAMFGRHEALLKQDKKLYRPMDIQTANRLAAAILEALGAAATAEEAYWSGMQPRVWTKLFETYEEVSRGGRFLFSKDRAEERFPSLAAVGRTFGARSTKAEEGDSKERGSQDSPPVPQADGAPPQKGSADGG